MSTTYTSIPTEVESTSGTVTNATNAVTDITSDTYATVTATAATAQSTTVTAESFLYLGFNLSNLPSNAIINSLSTQIKYSRTGTYSGSNKYAAWTTYLYIRPYTTTTNLASTNTTGQTLAVTTTTLTATSTSVIGKTIEEMDSYLRIAIRSYARTRSVGGSASTTTNTLVYGAKLTLEYTLNGIQYKVKINGTWLNGNVKTKVNGQWVDAKSAYIKKDGLWYPVV